MLLEVAFTFLLAFFTYKFVRWNLQYFYKLSVINKMKGLQILPYVGNAHQLKRKHGKLEKILNFVY